MIQFADRWRFHCCSATGFADLHVPVNQSIKKSDAATSASSKKNQMPQQAIYQTKQVPQQGDQQKDNKLLLKKGGPAFACNKQNGIKKTKTEVMHQSPREPLQQGKWQNSINKCCFSL